MLLVDAAKNILNAAGRVREAKLLVQVALRVVCFCASYMGSKFA